MLYVYTGEDIDTARAKVQATVRALLAKNTDALYFRVTPETLKEYSFEELTLSQSLFKREYIVVLDMLCSTSEGEYMVLSYVEHIARAPHLFFVLEGKLKKETYNTLAKHAASVTDFKTKAARGVETFNTFALTDALAVRDAKTLWRLYHEALRSGVSAEEVHGILFWMLKSLVLAAHARTAEEAGMKPYPFTKAKRAVKAFGSFDELNAHVRRFALLPTQARTDGVPLSLVLEEYILTL